MCFSSQSVIWQKIHKSNFTWTDVISDEQLAILGFSRGWNIYNLPFNLSNHIWITSFQGPLGENVTVKLVIMDTLLQCHTQSYQIMDHSPPKVQKPRGTISVTLHLCDTDLLHNQLIMASESDPVIIV